MKEVKGSILLRVYLVYLGILLFALAIMGRAVFIQTFESSELIFRAKKQELWWMDVEAIRGNICADDGTLLATSIPIFDVRMDVCTDSITDAFFRKNVDSLAICLARLFKDRSASQYRDELWEARRNGDRYFLVKRKITYPELKELRTFPIFRRGKYLGGLLIIPHYQRELPHKHLAMRTIGYESRDESSKVYVGLEGYFSQHLQGVTGKRLMRKTGTNAWVPVDLENELEPQNGDDIITTIDINIQGLTERALMKELIADSADHGCAVVMEVNTGFVKAIANLKRVAPGRYEENYNYAVGESTEPGSTFKLASFLVALEDGKVDLHTPVATGNGEVSYSGRTLSDSHQGGYGTITAREVFEVSSNVGTSKIIYQAYAAQPQKYIDGLYRLGIQRPLGLQISGEGTPRIKQPKDKLWSKLSLPWMSVGYEVAMTPLQLLTLYNAVANNGIMVKPVFVREILRNGRVVKTFGPEVINPSIGSPATLAKVNLMLQGVVERGTAKRIHTSLYKIAGKTGTAQIARNNRGYGKDGNNIQYQGSFVGFFPADHPKYSIIVVISDPSRGKYYGGAIAGPVFREISDHLYVRHPEIQYTARTDTLFPLFPYSKAGHVGDFQKIFSALNMHPDPVNPAILWARPKQDQGSVSLVPIALPGNRMPDVTGMGLKDAIFLLEQKGLRVTVRGKGAVVRQSIPAGSQLITGQTVEIELETFVKPKKSESKPEA